MNSTNGYLFLIWGIVAVLIGLAIALLTSGSIVLAWVGVLLMLAAVGGVGNWVWLAWHSTQAQLKSQSDE